MRRFRKWAKALIANELHDRYLGTEQAADDYCDEVVDGEGRLQYLDMSGSVSALVEVEDDFDYDPKHIELNTVRFLQLEMFCDG